MKKFSNRILVFSFLIIIMASLLSYVFGNHKEFSENENRYLAKKPKFSIENLKSGKLTEDIEKYIDDQFILRDRFISIKTKMLVELGKKDINNVYIADKGYLIQKHLEKDFDYNNLEKNLDFINQFLKKHKDKNNSLMIAPTSGLVLKDYLPENAPMVDQEAILKKIEAKINQASFIDLTPTLTRYKDGYVYYKTDHHWTSFGAYYAYCKWTGQYVNLNNHKIEEISQDFKGSLYSKVLWEGAEADSIHVFDKDRQDYTITYDSKERLNSIYNLNKVKSKDKYQVFMNGNHSRVKIDTEVRNGKHILVIKDSFANAFIPFLISDFESIHVVDLRYYNGDINKYIEEKNITDILFLYNIINFSEDTSIQKLIK